MKRTKLLTIRVTEEEKEILEKGASLEGQDVANFIRSYAIKRSNIAKRREEKKGNCKCS